MRKINFPFLIGLLALGAATAVGVHLLHGHQVRRNASALLERAQTAEAANDLEKAENELGRYLNINPRDAGAWARYARLLDRKTPTGPERSQVYLVLERAQRDNPKDAELERRCAEVGLELGRFSDARRHLRALLEQGPKDAAGKPADAELEDLLGQCDQGESKPSEAEGWYRKAVAHEPGRVEVSNRLARLLRLDARPEEADRAIEEMVEANPRSAMAYVYRYRYNVEFRRNADKADVARALEFGPDEAEVLITAADLARQDDDVAAARKHLESGLQKHPDDPVFYQMSAGVEMAENHPDRAEAVLRRGIAAAPSNVHLKLLLAMALISQEKLDGDDGATSWIKRLQKLGLTDGYVYNLEARVAMTRRKWTLAISKFESARSLLAADPAILSVINLQLVECYSHTGEKEKQVAALRRAASGGTTAAAAGRLLAESMESEGRLDEAVKLHASLVEKRPESRLDLVRLLIKKNLRLPQPQRRWQEVEQRLRESEKATPSAVEDLTRTRADLLAAQNRFDEARKLLTTALAEDPRNLNYRLAVAGIARKEAKPSQAVQVLDQAEKDLGPSLEIQLARLALWGERGGDEARAAVAKLAESRKHMKPADLPEYLDRLARTAVRLREPVLAGQYWGELAALQPENLDVLESLFDLALQNKDLAGARELVERIRKVEGDGGASWRFSEAALDLDEYRREPQAPGASQRLKAAGELAVSISELRPDWWGGPALKGQIAELKGLTDEAVEQFKQAVARGGLQPAVVNRLMTMLYRKPGDHSGEIEQVVGDLRSRGYRVEDLAITEAVAAIGKGDAARGLALARQTVSESSNNYSDHLMLGRLYTIAGRRAEAEKELKRAVELAPGVPDVWLAYLEHVATTTRRPDQARAVIEAASRALPADQSALTLAQCWMLVGDSKKAEALIQQARAEHPEDPATLQSLVLFYINQGRMSEAGKTLDAFEKMADVSQDGLTWASRIRPGLLMSTRRLADQDEALRMIDENLRRSGGGIVDLRMKISGLAARPGRRGEAIKLLEDLVSTSDAPTLTDRFYLAKLYQSENMVEQYEREMLKLVGPGKANLADTLAHYSRFLLDRNKLDEAGRYLSLLKEADPGGLATLELESKWLDLRDQKAELLALLAERGRKFPDQIGQVGDLLALYGFNREAEQAYKDFIERQTDQPRRVLVLANFYARTGRTAEAMAILSKAWTTLPQEHVGQAALAVYDAPSATAPQKQQVRDWVEAVVKAQPDSWLKGRLCNMFLDQGKPEEAISGLREMLAGNPDNPAVLNNLAWNLGLLDQSSSEEALRMIDHAIEVAGKNPTLLDTRAFLLIRAGRFDEAIQMINLAEELPVDRESLRWSLAVHLAWAYQGKGQIEKARDAFQRAEARGFRLDSSNVLERPFLAKLRQDLGLGAEPAPSPSG